jgi:hypothetical protein
MLADAPAPASAGTIVAHLELTQPYLDTERILAMLRARCYRLVRLVLVGSDCHLWVEARQTDIALLGARLARIGGTRLFEDVEWRP